MLENEKLRQADIFAGIVISLFGLWVISQAMQMPMKDSWGGVQNVWFVSPALFPLFVGGVIVLLGIGLPDDNLHAPNEKMDLDQFYRGIEASAYLMEELGKA